ncbi:MAG TPA: hypothetical protein VG675_11210 [Bryobacteraceae bacterium]|nr:hypothetical protein [Bryobacteraceae bacterium]
MTKIKKGDSRQVAVVPNLQPTCTYRVVALDPSVRGSDRNVLTADIEIPNEQLSPGPRGYRVQVVDYDSSNRILYEPADVNDKDNLKVPKNLEKDRAFHARNVYAIVMRVLARFERALGRRVGWSFLGHQLTLAPHAFVDLNAFYSKDDRAIFFGYYPDDGTNVFTCLSHEVIAHETTHALVDGLRPDYLYPSSPDQAAFHEGFADIVALLSVLSLREVVTAALDLHTSKDQKLIRASALTTKALKEGVLFGLAQQVGEAMYGTHGVALRRSIELSPDPKLARTDEFTEPHRRGELLVAAVLGAFLKIWKGRIDQFGELQRGMVSRVGVVDGAVETADHLLTIVIRALDYCPPTDLLFGDFLSAMLTADYEVYPDDSRYGYRQALRQGFASFGFRPGAEVPDGAAEPGLWGDPGDVVLLYTRTHFESMQHDPNEVFRFLWENRAALGVDERAYTKIDAVWPCYRVGSDGFLLRETVAVYTQQIRLEAHELHQLGIRKPSDMPDDLSLSVYGGGTLIFDESGRLKYHVRNRLGNARRQNPRLQYLWKQGALGGKKSFAALHLERVLRHDVPAAPDIHSDEEDDNHAGAAN